MRYLANFFIFLYNLFFGWFFGKLDYYDEPRNDALQKNIQGNDQPQNNKQKPDAIILDTSTEVLEALTKAFPNPLELTDEELKDFKKKGYTSFEPDKTSENDIHIASFNFKWDNARIIIENSTITELVIYRYDKDQIEAVKKAITPLLSSVEQIRGSPFVNKELYEITVNVQYNKSVSEKVSSDRYWHQDGDPNPHPLTSIIYFNHKGTEATFNLKKAGDQTAHTSIQTHTHPSVIFDNNFFEHKVSDITRTGDDTSVRCLLTIFWGQPGRGAIRRDHNNDPSIQDLRKSSPRR